MVNLPKPPNSFFYSVLSPFIALFMKPIHLNMKIFKENHFGILLFESDAEEEKEMGKVGNCFYIIEDIPLKSGKKLDLVFALNKKYLGVSKPDIIAACNTYLRGDFVQSGLKSKSKEEYQTIGIEMSMILPQACPSWTQVLFVADDCQLKEIRPRRSMDQIKVGALISLQFKKKRV